MLDSEDGFYKKDCLKKQKTLLRQVLTEEDTSALDEDKDNEEIKNKGKNKNFFIRRLI